MGDAKAVPDGQGEIPDSVRRRIEELDEQLASLDFYALLGIDRTATRPQVRSAFLAVAPMFHPDRYFGKKIGAVYLAKMERIFSRMGIARDSLLDDELRAAYDRTLPSVVSAGSSMQAPPTPASSPRHKSSVEARPPSDPAPPRGSASGMRVTASDSDRARAFASRLSGGMRVSTPAVPLRSPFTDGRRDSSGPRTAVDPKVAVEVLKREYERRRSSGTAVNAAAVRAQAEVKEEERAAAVERAKEAETKQDFAQAAIEWGRAFEALAGADTANRAALCFRRAGELRRAARYAEEAVRLEPSNAAHHVTLALVCFEAGLSLRAVAEVERAIALDPLNPRVKEVAARIKGGRGAR